MADVEPNAKLNAHMKVALADFITAVLMDGRCSDYEQDQAEDMVNYIKGVYSIP